MVEKTIRRMQVTLKMEGSEQESIGSHVDNTGQSIDAGKHAYLLSRFNEDARQNFSRKDARPWSFD